MLMAPPCGPAGNSVVPFALRCLSKERSQFDLRVTKNQHLHCSFWKKDRCQVVQFGNGRRQYQSGNCAPDTQGGSCRGIRSEPHLRGADGRPGSVECGAGHSGERCFLSLVSSMGRGRGRIRPLQVMSPSRSCVLKGHAIVLKRVKIGYGGQ